MASFPQNQFKQFLQHPTQQSQQSKPFRDLYNSNMEGQITQQVPYFNNPKLLDHHPPYIPPFQVAGLAPGPEENGQDLEWNFGLETKKKRPIEQVFLENNLNHNNSSNNNSQISTVDLFRARSVSTGLGLSLENPRLSSSGDSPLLGLVGDAIDKEFQRQDAEMDRYIKLQGDCLRQAVLEKFQASQLRMISYIEEKVIQKFREKETEVEDMNKKNRELESQLEHLSLEANAWQQRAKYSENVINTLKHNLQQVYAQSKDSREGCGDSEIDDAASCCKVDFELLCRDGKKEPKEMLKCKVCRVNDACMVLLPCKHMCLCKGCEMKFSACPLCDCIKYMGMEVYM